jgi:hypothetical protein
LHLARHIYYPQHNKVKASMVLSIQGSAGGTVSETFSVDASMASLLRQCSPWIQPEAVTVACCCRVPECQTLGNVIYYPCLAWRQTAVAHFVQFAIVLAVAAALMCNAG